MRYEVCGEYVVEFAADHGYSVGFRAWQVAALGDPRDTPPCPDVPLAPAPDGASDWPGAVRLFDRADTCGLVDVVSNPSLAKPCVSGYVKWDEGASFNADDVNLGDGRANWLEFAQLVAFVYTRCREILRASVHDVDALIGVDPRPLRLIESTDRDVR